MWVLKFLIAIFFHICDPSLGGLVNAQIFVSFSPEFLIEVWGYRCCRCFVDWLQCSIQWSFVTVKKFQFTEMTWILFLKVLIKVLGLNINWNIYSQEKLNSSLKYFANREVLRKSPCRATLFEMQELLLYTTSNVVYATWNHTLVWHCNCAIMLTMSVLQHCISLLSTWLVLCISKALCVFPSILC